MTEFENIPPADFAEKWEQAQAIQALQEKADELAKRQEKFVIGGHIDHTNINAAMKNVALLVHPEHDLEHLRDLERIERMQTHCLDLPIAQASNTFGQEFLRANLDAPIMISSLPDLIQPTIEKPKISKHLQARQERFRARHK